MACIVIAVIGDASRTSREAASRRVHFYRGEIQCVLAGMTFGMIGCTEETGSKEEIKTTTPGGTSKETREIKVQKSGDNPPAAPSETAKP
jgi:hypothetical protein